MRELMRKYQRETIACPFCNGEGQSKGEVCKECSGLGRGVEATDGHSEYDLGPGEVQRVLAEDTKVVLLDVREPHEFEIVKIDGARLIPLSELHLRTNELDTADTIVTYCHHGQRSLTAIKTLEKFGFRKLKHLRGGIDAWACEVNPEMARY
jgi:adenylyltransferase/sulfurtransferase